jgi:CubicO group peptidase (beta-lactamase class C family)
MNKRGLRRPRLARLHDALLGYVERGEISGLVALVSRHDDVEVTVGGSLAFGGRAAMKRDTPFRIASLTKLVTAVAAMVLVEDGKLRLDESIEPWVPELGGRRVLTSVASPLDDTVPALRAITLRDVLTYRMGFGSVMAMPNTCPIQAAIRENRIGGDGPMLPRDYPATDEWVRRLGALPWIAQPGERWLYHVSGDLLGVLVARAAGASLGAFMRERIFEPLGMRNSSFQLSMSEAARLPVLYSRNPQTGALEPFDDPLRSAWVDPPALEAGGGGLVSTIDDYFAFSRMMLSKGRLGRERILSRRAVELMTSDHLTPSQRTGAELFFGEFSSWGLGMAVDIRRHDLFHTPGRFGWTGGFGTTAYVDPAEDLIGILFTQRMMDSPEPPTVFTDFWTLAYTAVE